MPRLLITVVRADADADELAEATLVLNVGVEDDDGEDGGDGEIGVYLSWLCRKNIGEIR